MPITIKKPVVKTEETKVLSPDMQNQIAESTKLDTTDYTKTIDEVEKRPQTVTVKAKEKLDVINLKYPEGTTQRVKTFYSSTGHNMTSGFLMSFELTTELVERGIVTFSKGGYRINAKLEQ